MGVIYSQFFPPTPILTEANLPSQIGKVFLITGATSGIGYELATILYHAGGKVYITGRTKEKVISTIEKIKSTRTKPATGSLEYLVLRLDDLSSIKSTVEDFKSKESKLDVLWNNAGVSLPALGSVSEQGHELQIAVNVLGPFLLTRLLLSSLDAAQTTSSPRAARVIWTSSQIVDLQATNTSKILSELSKPPQDQQRNYLISKLSNWILAHEFSKQHPSVLSLVQNPGNLKTPLLRNVPTIMRLLSSPLLYEPKMGAYTELWAGLSEDIGLSQNGGYVIPWGRMHPGPNKEIVEALKGGLSEELFDWCVEKTKEYM